MSVNLSLSPADFTVQSDAEFLPARLFGSASSRTRKEEPFYLAVAINDLIQAVTRVDGDGLGRAGSRWEMMVSETSFRSGENEVRFFVIDEVNGNGRLRTVKTVFADSRDQTEPD